MIIYEVTVKVGKHIAGEFERYMIEQHIPDVLRTGAFTSANFLLTADGQYQTRYAAKSRDELERYYNENADALRLDVSSRFPEGLEFSRREWDMIRTWKC
jgi:hypothetical protein